MQFLVPQNIDLEDKVIGPFTLKQFMYLLAGGILDYFLFSLFGFTALFFLFALPISAFFVALAMLKIQDQPFPKFLQSLILFVIKPKIRTWGRTFIKPIILDKGKVQALQSPEPAKQVSKSELVKLAQIIDTRGWSNTQNISSQPGAENINLSNRVVSASRAQPKYNLSQQNQPKDIWQDLRKKLTGK